MGGIIFMALALLGCMVKTGRKARSRRTWHATNATSCDQTDRVVIVASARLSPEQSMSGVLTACHEPILVFILILRHWCGFLGGFCNLTTWGFRWKSARLISQQTPGKGSELKVHYWNVAPGGGTHTHKHKTPASRTGRAANRGMEIFWGLHKCGAWFRRVSARAWMQRKMITLSIRAHDLSHNPLRSQRSLLTFLSSA